MFLKYANTGWCNHNHSIRFDVPMKWYFFLTLFVSLRLAIVNIPRFLLAETRSTIYMRDTRFQRMCAISADYADCGLRINSSVKLSNECHFVLKEKKYSKLSLGKFICEVLNTIVGICFRFWYRDCDEQCAWRF